MLELGSAERDGHWRVGERAASACNLLITVGERARVIADGARDGGAEVRHLTSTSEAIDALKHELRTGDHLLIKASRAMAFEEAVSALTET